MALSFAASSKPARDAALGLGGAVFDLLVELVDGFQGFAFGILGVGLCVALELAGFSIGISPLRDMVSNSVSLSLFIFLQGERKSKLLVEVGGLEEKGENRTYSFIELGASFLS